MDSSASCLSLQRVSRHFGGLKAVDDVTLAVPAGERHVIIGPNGAGKTTLFNLISGELAPSAGTIRLFGADITNLPSHRRARRGIARTFQITRLFPALTLRDNLLLACEALDRRRFDMFRPRTACRDLAERASQLLRDFGLSSIADAQASQVSYGEQRRLEVALSMAGRPRLLLLDEPLAGLSAVERETMQAILERLDPAMAVLLIEHDIDVAFALAQRITVLHQGRMLVQGTTDEIRTNSVVQQSYLGSATE